MTQSLVEKFLHYSDESKQLSDLEVLPYFNFNCAKQIDDKVQNLPIYFITNDQQRNVYTCEFKKAPEDHQDLDRSQSLSSFQRMNMFNRIRQRAGAASFETRERIKSNHRKILEQVYLGLVESFALKDEKVLMDHLSNCVGVKFKNFE